MGFMDLSTSATSKKHVDFNDARYQLADKLKQNNNKNIRSTFTLYDSRDFDKVAVQDISAAYALSDKKLSMGELLNKMVDLTLDMEDGVLDTEKDAVYAWKYSVTLLQIYDDKRKRQETLNSFDNGLKNSIINSKVFIERYPGKYTSRTNFFDAKLKNELIENIVTTFKEAALPKIHESAIKQSKEIAERHSNPILDKIVHWAIENYKCAADSFFAVTEDAETGLFYSVNTIILHLRNGYDMSIVGHVGTDRDDQFAISILNANDISIKKHGERINRSDIESALSEASDNDPIDPLSKLLAMEKKKNAILTEQYDILAAIRPMIPAEALALKAAESVVGQNYIWGCQQWRENHEDLPRDFKLSDVTLPVFVEETGEMERQQALASEISKFTNDVDDLKDIEAANIIDKPPQSNDQQDSLGSEQQSSTLNDSEQVGANSNETQPETPMFVMPPTELFETKKEVKPEKKFGESTSDFKMPRLNLSQAQQTPQTEAPKVKEKAFDVATTMLPGMMPTKKKEVDNTPSITQQAIQMPTITVEKQWKPVEEQPAIKEEVKKEKDLQKDEFKQPDLVLDDLDSLFN